MAEAERDVARWREKNPKVVNHWYRHQDWLAFSANHGDAEHVVPLASGRNLTYWNPRWCASQFDKSKKSIKAEFIKTDTPLHVYGGKLTENEIQALARDVMVSGWLRAADAGILPSFTVHDELVAPVALDSVKDAIEELTVILRTPPEWAKDLPLDIEMAKMERYAK
jgi:DNA polymerase